VTFQLLDLDSDGSADDIRIRGDGKNNAVPINDNPDTLAVLFEQIG
jgi:hypothetical protein